MCLPKTVVGGMICVVESGKSMTLHLYDHGTRPLRYKIRRAQDTRKFPKLNITFRYDGGFGKDYYGCIAVPEFQIDIAGAMTYTADHDLSELNYEFDMNEYDTSGVIKYIDEITVRLYTQANSFHGYVNAIYDSFRN